MLPIGVRVIDICSCDMATDEPDADILILVRLLDGSIAACRFSQAEVQGRGRIVDEQDVRRPPGVALH